MNGASVSPEADIGDDPIADGTPSAPITSGETGIADNRHANGLPEATERPFRSNRMRESSDLAHDA
jgi:hypothetical protein